MKRVRNYIKYVVALATVFVASPVLAADEEASNFSKFMQYIYDNMIIVLGIIALIAGVITIINLIFRFLEIQKLRMLQEMGVEKEEVMEELKTPSIKRMYDWLWSVVPVAGEKTIDLGHDYDGIRELDNRLPPWWLGLMYGSIIFAVVYMYYYHWRDTDWSSVQEYEVAMEKAEEEKALFLEQSANAVDENSVVLLTDEAALSSGKDIYMAQCAACHAADGGGLVGPNFTDDFWVHGGSINDVFSTIKYGVPEKGMIAWASQLKPVSMQNVASYILSLQGTTPANPKAPEGEKYVPEDAQEAPAAVGDAAEGEDASSN